MLINEHIYIATCIFTDLFIGDFYFQSLSPNPTMIKYLQPVNLTFMIALRSNGAFNTINTVEVFQYDASDNLVREHTARNLNTSSQTYNLNLGQAEVKTAGNYTISMYANFAAKKCI